MEEREKKKNNKNEEENGCKEHQNRKEEEEKIEKKEEVDKKENNDKSNEKISDSISIECKNCNSKKNEIEKLKEELKRIESEFEEKIKKKENECKELKNTLELDKKKYNKEIDEKEKQINDFIQKEKNLKNELNEKEKLINNLKTAKSENETIIDELNNENSELEKEFENEKNKNKNYKEMILKLYQLIKETIDKDSVIENKRINEEYFKIEKIWEDKRKNDIDNKIKGKVGLYNEEYNCYMNSVIQILKNIKNFFININNIDKKDDNILIFFNDLLYELLYSNKECISLLKFKNYFSKEYKRFEGKKPNDSTLFLIYLLQHLHKILKKSNRRFKINLNFYSNLGLDRKEKEKLQEFLNTYESKNDSYIHDLFFGYQMNKILCSGCHNFNVSFQSFNILHLSLFDERTKLKSLEECLNCYLITKDQKGDLDFECTNCKNKLISNVIIIIKLPPILIINLKRVGEKKIYYDEIKIPFTLKTKDIEKLSKFNMSYELIGFIKHYGNEQNGHNVAYTKNNCDNKWYEFDDKVVKEIRGIPSTEKSFLFFYQLIKD